MGGRFGHMRPFIGRNRARFRVPPKDEPLLIQWLFQQRFRNATIAEGYWFDR